MTTLQTAGIKSPMIAGSRCFRCDSEMFLSRIEPKQPGYEHHIFECPKCRHSHQVVMEIR